MIICFEGTPGSGKSYEAVKKIIDNLRNGRTVYTNIEGMAKGYNDEQREMVKTVTGMDDYEFNKRLIHLENSQVPEYWKHVKPGALIVIDEAQNFFNARDWQTEKNKQCNAWCSTHRHHGFDVVFITQDIARLDSAVRSLMEWTYRFRKMNFFGGLTQQKYICYSYAGDGQGKQLAKPNIRTYDPMIFKCYSSYVAKDIKELGIMKHVNILKHPIFYAIPVTLIFFVYMFSKSSFAKGEIIPGAAAAKAKMEEIKARVHPKKNDEIASVVKSAPSVTAVAKVEEKISPEELKEQYVIVGMLEDGTNLHYIVIRASDAKKEERRSYLVKAMDIKKLGSVGQQITIPESLQWALH
jgi:zona occludens toxin